MTNTHTTQAAAQRCADLANEADHIAGDYTADFFNDDGFRSNVAFRRYVETEDATKREVLALLGTIPTGFMPMGSADQLDAAKSILRANILPDSKPTLLDEFLEIHPVNPDWGHGPAFKEGARQALDWIAKREGKPNA